MAKSVDETPFADNREKTSWFVGKGFWALPVIAVLLVWMLVWLLSPTIVQIHPVALGYFDAEVRIVDDTPLVPRYRDGEGEAPVVCDLPPHYRAVVNHPEDKSFTMTVWCEEQPKVGDRIRFGAYVAEDKYERGTGLMLGDPLKQYFGPFVLYRKKKAIEEIK